MGLLEMLSEFLLKKRKRERKNERKKERKKESKQSSQTLRDLEVSQKRGDIPANYRVLNNYYAEFRNGNRFKDTALRLITNPGNECYPGFANELLRWSNTFEWKSDACVNKSGT